MSTLAADLASALRLRPEQVERTLALLDGGATVPFVARYRKEATGGLDEVAIRSVQEAAAARRELDERRAAVLRSIEEQGKLTAELRAALEAAPTKTALEDLYLPFRPKRRTRASVARERGLEPLAELVWKQETVRGDRLALAGAHASAEKGVADADAALAGARDICAERVSEDAALRSLARSLAAKEARLESSVVPAKRGERSKFESWYEHAEALATAASHRVLAVLRGEAEGFLRVKIALPDEAIAAALTARVVRRRDSIFAADLREAVQDAWARLLAPSLENELRGTAKERADREAIAVFGRNLRELLLAPPAGARSVVALDPGLRTGVKVAALDGTGALRETATLYTERSAEERARAARTFVALVHKHAPQLVAVGNGTGSREAEAFVRDALREAGRAVPVVSVSEQGASVYSASDAARAEFPDLDVSLRGAVSIGRRLQDPLAELVKLDPKSIGVGQYQHDVDQKLLRRELDDVVDSCVNAVGVDANLASAELLEHVSGVGAKLARAIVAHRNQNGPFRSRADLRKVPGVGPRTFEQAAGFLRVRGGDPLDDSAVHPERYGLVERMARDLGVGVRELVGRAELVRRIDWRRYVAGDAGEPTLRDVLAELEMPGRDPRGDFAPPAFREDLRGLEDLREGMVLPGVVTNVTAFGAFVDVGVHQDGLVHVSQLADRYVKDPAEVVHVGERVQVRVLGVDLARKRLSLTRKGLGAR